MRLITVTFSILLNLLMYGYRNITNKDEKILNNNLNEICDNLLKKMVLNLYKI